MTDFRQTLRDPYFTSRQLEFWMCLVFCLCMVFTLDGLAAVSPDMFHLVFVSNNAAPSELDLKVTRIRGVVAVMATLFTLIMFLKKVCLTRWLVKFAIAFTVFFFVYDIVHSYLEGDVLMIAQNPFFVAFLLSRPIALFCLLYITADLERTRRYEAPCRWGTSAG